MCSRFVASAVNYQTTYLLVLIESHFYTLQESPEEVWDCMLNQTNIKNNNNKYYLIQLLKEDAKKRYCGIKDDRSAKH